MPNDFGIRSVDISSFSLDEEQGPNSGSLTVRVGSVDVRLTLDQAQIDALVAAAEPIASDIIHSIGETMSTKAAA